MTQENLLELPLVLEAHVDADGHVEVDLPSQYGGLDVELVIRHRPVQALKPWRELSEEEWRERLKSLIGVIEDDDWCEPDDPLPEPLDPWPE